jgi:formylglycine-generating enzyme required for sulfatase activity
MQTVGQKPFGGNAFGLYDMHGNAQEWVWDWDAPYDVTDLDNPKGPDTGTDRQSRGGHSGTIANRMRSAYRYGVTPSFRDTGMGLRVVRSKL